jgi:hypothetical protein
MTYDSTGPKIYTKVDPGHSAVAFFCKGRRVLWYLPVFTYTWH